MAFVLTAPAATASERLLSVLAAATQVFHELDRERLLEQIVDTARRIVRARYGALGVFNEARRIEQFITSGLSDRERARIQAGAPQGRGLLGALLDSPGPIRVDDLSAHPSSVGFPDGHPRMRSFLGVPVRFQGRLMGNLYLTEKEGGEPFDREDEMVVTFFAAQAGIALENARLFHRANGEVRSLQTLLDSIPDAVYTTDRERRLTRMNRSAAVLTNGRAGEFLGKLVCDAFRYTDQSGIGLCPERCPTRTAIESGKTIALPDLEFVTAPKGFPAALIVAPIHDYTGAVTGSVAICRDVRLLRAAEEMRNNIISLVSHELRTPLFHIKGFASSLLQKDVELDEETRTDFIAIIDQEADRLTRLVSDLLDMSRLESSTVRLEPSHVPVEALVMGGVRRAQPFLKNHKVETLLSHPSLTARADPIHVERVLENVLENAAKYAPRGTSITVSVAKRRGMVEVVVCDHGPGIPLAERERVFEKFVRLGDRAQRPPGTGLGLSICKAIVEQHGGRIWITGEEGKGAQVHFTLPVARRKGPAAERGRLTSKARAQPRSELGGKHG